MIHFIKFEDRDRVMETIVLDYSDGSVVVFSHHGKRDVEKMLVDKGFRLQDCEWMTVKRVVVKNRCV